MQTLFIRGPGYSIWRQGPLGNLTVDVGVKATLRAARSIKLNPPHNSKRTSVCTIQLSFFFHVTQKVV